MRIPFDIALFFAVVVTPLPFSVFLITLGLFLYPRYFESVAAAALIEFLYRGSGEDMFCTNVPLAVFALLALLLSEALRTVIRERRI